MGLDSLIAFFDAWRCLSGGPKLTSHLKNIALHLRQIV